MRACVATGAQAASASTSAHRAVATRPRIIIVYGGIQSRRCQCAREYSAGRGVGIGDAVGSVCLPAVLVEEYWKSATYTRRANGKGVYRKQILVIEDAITSGI